MVAVNCSRPSLRRCSSHVVPACSARSLATSSLVRSYRPPSEFQRCRPLMYTNVGSTKASDSKSQRGCSLYSKPTPGPKASARVAPSAISAPVSESAAIESDSPERMLGCDSASTAQAPMSPGPSMLYSKLEGVSALIR